MASALLSGEAERGQRIPNVTALTVGAAAASTSSAATAPDFFALLCLDRRARIASQVAGPPFLLAGGRAIEQSSRANVHAILLTSVNPGA